MTERELQRAITDLCDWLNLAWYHTHDSRRSVAGFPDLVIAGPGGILYREIKSIGGRVSDGQKKWLNTLNASGGDARIWYLANWQDGTVRKELTAIAKN